MYFVYLKTDDSAVRERGIQVAVLETGKNELSFSRFCRFLFHCSLSFPSSLPFFNRNRQSFLTCDHFLVA